MGREAECTCNCAGQIAKVKALIEPPELILRGGIKRKMPLAKLEEVRAQGDSLRFRFEGEEIAIEIGSALAAKWVKAITTSPPSLAKKLGVSGETRVQMIGAVDDDALREALDAAARVSKASGDLIVARVNTPGDVD